MSSDLPIKRWPETCELTDAVKHICADRKVPTLVNDKWEWRPPSPGTFIRGCVRSFKYGDNKYVGISGHVVDSTGQPVLEYSFSTSDSVRIQLIVPNGSLRFRITYYNTELRFVVRMDEYFKMDKQEARDHIDTSKDDLEVLLGIEKLTAQLNTVL